MADWLTARAAQARSWLFERALPLWWERGFDRAGDCFHERIGLDGAPCRDLPRRIRVQARQTLVYARAGALGWPGPWREAVGSGARILCVRACLPEGGTAHLLAPDGAVLDRRRDLYDLAFVILALAEAARALGGRDDLIAAAEAQLAWLEAHWSHPAGGFREGEVAPAPPRRQNPHMHLFEALLALHDATGKAEHLARAGRLAALLVDRMVDAGANVLPEHFDDAWRPLEPRIIEPGHHFEWCCLLERWRRLGGGDLSDIGERLRQFAETHGVDLASGAVYDELAADGRPRARTSRLWPHSERIKANLARFERTRDPAAAAAAAQAFDMLMRYCDTPIPGLWRDRFDLADGFVAEPAPASSFYHIVLALEAWDRVARAPN